MPKYDVKIAAITSLLDRFDKRFEGRVSNDKESK